MVRNNREKAASRQELFDLQNMLYIISRFENDGKPDVLPDGIFGEKTKQAIRKFQVNAGIAPSGIADFETWDAIAERYNEVVILKSRPQHIHFFDVIEAPYIGIGDKSDAVMLVQMLFYKMSDDFLGFKKCEISGHFDEITEMNVKEFQRVNRLEQHGIVDRKTWDRLAMYYNMF